MTSRWTMCWKSRLAKKPSARRCSALPKRFARKARPIFIVFYNHEKRNIDPRCCHSISESNTDATGGVFIWQRKKRRRSSRRTLSWRIARIFMFPAWRMWTALMNRRSLPARGSVSW